MSTLKVDTILSPSTPTFAVSDGLTVSGVTTMTNTLNVDAGSNGMIDFGDLSGGYGRLYADSTGTFIGSKSNDPLILRTNHTEVARLDEYGRMMIGQTAAVIGSSSEFAEIVLSGKTRGAGITLKDVDANTQFQIRTDDAGGDPMTLLNASTNHPIAIRTNNTERLRITNAGNVGINSTVPSAARLVVQTTSGTSFAALKDNTGAAIGFGGATQPRILLEAGASASDLLFYTAGGSSWGSPSWSERLRIASNGALGIGGANYGTSGQVLTSGGSGAAISWAAASGGKVLGWAFGDIGSQTVAGATSSNKIDLFSQAYTPTNANSTILIICWINIDCRTSSYCDRIRIQGSRDDNLQQARWLHYGQFGDSSGAILQLPYTYKPTGWSAGSSSTFKVLIHSDGSSGSPTDQHQIRLHENGNYLLVELGT